MMSEYVNLRRVEFVVTRACSSRCRHCHVDGQKSDASLDARAAVGALESLAGAYALDSVMTFGGEPLLRLDVVCAIHAAAARLGIPSRELITNACWTGDASRLGADAARLAQAGVNEVNVSVDAFHQEFLDLGRLRPAVRALIDAGLPRLRWHPCWAVSAEADNPLNEKTRQVLRELSDLGLPCSEGNVLGPSPAAIANFPEYLRARSTGFAGSCADVPYQDSLDRIESICFSPDGSVAVCEGFPLANLRDHDIVASLEAYDPYRDDEPHPARGNGRPRSPGARARRRARPRRLLLDVRALPLAARRDARESRGVTMAEMRNLLKPALVGGHQ
jgi:hypothetical protein